MKPKIIGYIVYSDKDGLCGLTRYELKGPDVLCCGGHVALFATRAAAKRAIQRTYKYAERENYRLYWPIDHRISAVVPAKGVTGEQHG